MTFKAVETHSTSGIDCNHTHTHIAFQIGVMMFYCMKCFQKFTQTCKWHQLLDLDDVQNDFFLLLLLLHHPERVNQKAWPILIIPNICKSWYPDPLADPFPSHDHDHHNSVYLTAHTHTHTQHSRNGCNRNQRLTIFNQLIRIFLQDLWHVEFCNQSVFSSLLAGHRILCRKHTHTHTRHTSVLSFIPPVFACQR